MALSRPPRARAARSHRAGVERAAHDDARDAGEGGELADVVERADPAGGDHRDAARPATAPVAPEIRAGLRAVARDVGVDDRGGARRRRVARQRHRVEVEDARPPVHRDAPVGGVDADDDPIAEATAQPAEERGVERGARPHDGPPAPASSTASTSLDRPQAAAHLAPGSRRPRSSRARAGLGRAAREGAVEIDDVEPAARRRPASGGPSPPGRRRRPSPRRRRPWRSRTQRPALRSTAGMISNMRALSGDRGRAPRSSRAAGCPSAGSSPGGTGSRRRCPAPTAAGKVTP